MPDDPRVQQILDELLDSDVTPEEACKSCAELLPTVRDRWRQIRRARAEFDELFPMAEASTDSSPSAADGIVLPVISGYEIESVVGRGGMGVVFRARHLRLNRVVALKMALAGAYAGRQERERFQREAEAVAVLRHANVVQVHDVGDSDGRPYFTMEYVEGGSLAQKLAGTPQPAHNAAALVATLAGAVHAAHRAGIVHRDLKPANILLTADGTPKVSDFGLARRLSNEPGLTRTGAALGTPSYMAPEQARGKSDTAGPAADIYALGAILYELLTGRPPFRAESASETLQQVLSQPAVPPSRLNGNVPRDLETICLKCLQKEPLLRYATAALLADDLRCFVQGEPIAAQPESRLARAIRRIRRRPLLSAAVAAATLSTVALLGGGVWMAAERDAAKRAKEADLAATERAAEDDLNEMVKQLKKESWPEARAAIERAKGRLGENGPERLRARLDKGVRDLELARRFEKIRLDRALDNSGRDYLEYNKAFREAGLGTFGDDPAVVAKRINGSDIRQSLVNALDDWALGASYDPDSRFEAWPLDVVRQADPDPQGWRDRIRDPLVRKNKEQLYKLADSANIETTPVNLLAALGELLQKQNGDSIPFLVKVQRRHPSDLWANFALGQYTRNPADAYRYYQAALAIRPDTPILDYDLGYTARWCGRPDEALYYCSEAVRLDPKHAKFRAGLARCLLDVGRDREAFDQARQGLELNPGIEASHSLQKTLRLYFMRQGKWDDARIAWQAALKAIPPKHDEWYGYAELCLFVGNEVEYRRGRTALLAKFGETTDPYVAERTSRACLLLPASADELRKAAVLAQRAVAVDRSKYQAVFPYFMFTQGLAEFRQARFDRAISIMQGDAGQMPGPAPRLVLAMALHQNKQDAEARKTLASAILAHDWSANKVHDQDDWICHVLRREAEVMILSK